jgi:hypothetical protein
VPEALEFPEVTDLRHFCPISGMKPEIFYYTEEVNITSSSTMLAQIQMVHVISSVATSQSPLHGFA